MTRTKRALLCVGLIGLVAVGLGAKGSTPCPGQSEFKAPTEQTAIFDPGRRAFCQLTLINPPEKTGIDILRGLPDGAGLQRLATLTQTKKTIVVGCSAGEQIYVYRNGPGDPVISLCVWDAE